MEIDLREPVQLGTTTQWIRITLTSLNCPIVMVQGRHDQVAPAASAARYAESLQAPAKQFVRFEHSAHMPHLEEPERFRELLAKVRLGLPANA